ncbi:histidine phosphatase family protein [Saccharibacillus sacchari]|uniref:Histidine phosphatase family protein n=1 Tax=Saccharibacillus sacchari TaxID=456493 RepID=A0ACC6P699_9BACL
MLNITDYSLDDIETETVLYFVRHAHSKYEHGRELERGLSDSGKAAALAVCRRLEQENIEFFVSSPYQRAIDTIASLAQYAGKTIEIYPALHERLVSGKQDLGPEGFAEAKRRCYEDPDYCPPGGESSRQARERALPVIRQLLREHAGKRIAIGTHGDVLTLMLGSWDQRYDYSFWQRLSMPDVYRVRFNGETFAGAEKVGYTS